MCSSGLEALSCPFSTKFLRSTSLRFTTSPAIVTYTLLPAGVLFHSICKPLSLLLLCVFVVLVSVSGVLIFLKGRKKYFEFFLKGWQGGSSFASFGLCLGLRGLQMCLHLCGSYFFLTRISP